MGLNDFKDWCEPDHFSQARMALKRGATGKAAALLKRAQSLGNQQVAEASGSQLAVARNRNWPPAPLFSSGSWRKLISTTSRRRNITNWPPTCSPPT